MERAFELSSSPSSCLLLQNQSLDSSNLIVLRGQPFQLPRPGQELARAQTSKLQVNPDDGYVEVGARGSRSTVVVIIVYVVESVRLAFTW